MAGWSPSEAFVWGLALATLAWMSLAIVSALALGMIIKRSDAAEGTLEGELPESETQGDVPSASGTRFRPVADVTPLKPRQNVG